MKIIIRLLFQLFQRLLEDFYEKYSAKIDKESCCSLSIVRLLRSNFIFSASLRKNNEIWWSVSCAERLTMTLFFAFSLFPALFSLQQEKYHRIKLLFILKSISYPYSTHITIGFIHARKNSLLVKCRSIPRKAILCCYVYIQFLP